MPQSQVIQNYADIMKDYDPLKNISRNILTKFEKTKIIGMRLEQLARGAPPYVDTTGITDIRAIALKELEERKLPMMLGRPMPGGKMEYFRLEDVVV